MMLMSEGQKSLWRNWSQCERCKGWERMGLSRYCPSCDADRIEAVEALALAPALENTNAR